ncbi:RraA family protein [bacterium]|nr:RraA family protein [bacterium]
MEFENEIKMFEFMEQFFYAGALSDILDEMGYPECAVSPAAMIRPLFSEAVCAGRVRTLLNAPMKTGTSDPYKLAIELLDSLIPGEVAVASSDKPIETGIMGELSAAAMMKRGGRGVIVDGYTRDARKLINLKFPTFVRGISPIDSTDRSAVVEYDSPVIIGGRRVKPGQIVFADLDGMVFIPQVVEMDVIQEAAKRVKVENEIRSRLESGASMREMWDKYHVL